MTQNREIYQLYNYVLQWKELRLAYTLVPNEANLRLVIWAEKRVDALTDHITAELDFEKRQTTPFRNNQNETL